MIKNTSEKHDSDRARLVLTRIDYGHASSRSL